MERINYTPTTALAMKRILAALDAIVTDSGLSARSRIAVFRVIRDITATRAEVWEAEEGATSKERGQ